MTFSRRRFFGASATFAGAGMAGVPTQRASSAAHQTHTQTFPSAAPPVELIALNRMAYGPRPANVERM
ncbi:MAG: hypothetical protein NZ699_10865 [Roseiflexus sp.]|nr:hypothetical protein [Roseiflexus sp.]MCS7289618.1 hypothetical protein [Roseiflexus sp.]MDW8146363.1 hypothetical protein [Roseiflexaceae bacterium]MDW8233195.1 hypothetical protein [Roseiflexaceae bacterium]